MIRSAMSFIGPKHSMGIVALVLCASQALAQENPTATAANAAKLMDLSTLAVAETPASDFAADSWSFQAYGSTSFGAPRRGKLYEAHAGVGYYFLDNISINAEFTGIGTSTQDRGGVSGQDALGGGFDLLFRWHFLHGDGWSIYTDGGAGLMQLTEPFPANGTGFNFTPQFGFGGTLRIYENWRFIAGARYQHISNAGLHGPAHNPGFDGAMVYAGLMLPF